jgi:hypothetical protein
MKGIKLREVAWLSAQGLMQQYRSELPTDLGGADAPRHFTFVAFGETGLT